MVFFVGEFESRDAIRFMHWNNSRLVVRVESPAKRQKSELTFELEWGQVRVRALVPLDSSFDLAHGRGK